VEELPLLFLSIIKIQTNKIMQGNMIYNWYWQSENHNSKELWQKETTFLNDAVLQASQNNRINSSFSKKKSSDFLSIYFTAGAPSLFSTTTLIRELQNSGADLIEIGIPSPDPRMDGQVIQNSHKIALENGMTISLLLTQIESIRKEISVPIILIGYLDSIIDFGVENFCARCSNAGVDGVIIPDMSVSDYKQFYKSSFKRYQINNIFLITPESTREEIIEADDLSDGFVYLVSVKGKTGARPTLTEEQLQYFERIQNMDLQNRTLVGFGISNPSTFQAACKYSDGAIVGSAFVEMIMHSINYKRDIQGFMNMIKGTHNEN
jgi:tryptophan synthase alpha chain